MNKLKSQFVSDDNNKEYVAFILSINTLKT